MDLNRKTFKTKLKGSDVEIEVSDLAKQAGGSVIGKYGDTVVLATATMSDKDKDLPFFPLTVDYEEKFYAIGEILGSRFVRREGRPSEEAVLSARLIDRTIRPLFDHRMRRSVQVMITTLSYDEEHDLETISLLSASTALAISNIPWDGPVAGVMFGEEHSGNDAAFFAGPKGKISMIELGGDEVPEKEAVEMFKKAQKETDKLVDFQEKIIKEAGKEKDEIEYSEPSEETKKLAKDLVEKHGREAIENGEIGDLKNKLAETLEEKDSDESVSAGKNYLDDQVKELVKKMVLEDNTRPDGRGLDEVRDLHSEVGLFKRAHGSGLFIRGDTQMLAMTTLAPPSAKKLVETIEMSGSKRFMLHYNFPSFSVGEAGRARGPGRREIGHGALAAKSLAPLIPEKEEFPYTIRIVAETLSSNGSTSMAATCAGSLALMDAGVPTKSHVGGIAMGLVKDGDDWEVLTDIQGPEDHYGVMDLKVTGTENGINAIQMDVKIKGITEDIFKDALPKAKDARLQILKVMKNAIKSPRKNVSDHAPTILNTKVDEDKIGMIIGPGGKTINRIIDKCGGEEEVSIDIEEDGRVFVAGSDREKALKAMEMVKGIVKEYEIDEVIEGEVVKILDFGAIVEFGEGQSGMIHVSELAEGYVENVKDEVSVGDKVRAKIIKKEDNGNIGLTLEEVL